MRVLCNYLNSSFSYDSDPFWFALFETAIIIVIIAEL